MYFCFQLLTLFYATYESLLQSSCWRVERKVETDYKAIYLMCGRVCSELVLFWYFAMLFYCNIMWKCALCQCGKLLTFAMWVYPWHAQVINAKNLVVFVMHISHCIVGYNAIGLGSTVTMVTALCTDCQMILYSKCMANYTALFWRVARLYRPAKCYSWKYGTLQSSSVSANP